MPKKFLQNGLAILIVTLIASRTVFAGSLTPGTSPAASGNTLSDIYNRLDTNALAGTHSFFPGSSPAGSFYTLSQIYNKIPTIDAGKILEDTSYLGITGTIAIKDSIIGADGSLNFSIPNGYYASKTCTASDTNLLAANIRSGVSIFGVSGSSNVVNTSAGTAAASDLLSGKIAFVGGSQITGSATAGSNVSGGNGLLSFAIPNGLYSSNKICTAADSSLLSENIKNGVTIFGVGGSATVVDTASSTAATTDILNGKTAYVNGALVTGDIQTQSLSNATTTVAAGYYAAADLATTDTDLTAGNIKSGTSIFGVAGNYSSTYTWTKEGAGSWVGVNENLDWVKEIGPSGWSSQTYSYCGASTCTNDGSLQGAASYDGPPGGWNGSNVTANFNNSALHNYEVIAADSTSLGDCTADAGDLVFPDGSVWDKTNVKPYSVKLADCDSNDANAAIIWAAAGGSGSQYANARNAPSAVSVADAWDGRKNLTTGVNGTHPYDNDHKNDDYYDRPAVSWYIDIGDGVGTSRLPLISEYEQARKGISSSSTCLLDGTNAWSYSEWSADQNPNNSNYARNFYANFGDAYYDVMDYQWTLFWVVVRQ